MQRVYLTRRNLTVLLSKLDRNRTANRANESACKSACTIVKQDTVHPKYPCSDVIYVTAVEDAEYYGTGDREPGRMLSSDEPKQRYPHADEMEY